MDQLYAIIASGFVVNVIVADGGFIALHSPDAVRIDAIDPRPGIGWRHEGGDFIAPGESNPPPTPDKTVFSASEFMQRFTLEELQAVFSPQMAEALTAEQKSALAVYVHYFQVAATVDVTSAITQNAVNFLASAGFITSMRAAAILAPEVIS